MHPVRQPNDFGGGNVLFTFCFELLFHFFRKDFDNTMSRNSVILIKYHFLLIFICSNHLKIIRSESVLIDFLNTVDELNRSCISILRKE